ncbi:ParB family chromosome partitioning protein [Phenylobacterium haematophilum]|uniref:ParB family chromosome partitioning protein n=1 Tax=Phenylobacterium haematophilum TaxID=98513 RepID=A0A839ZZH3_9CAUL|nr:ParB/RepB/Spo0J family partition protein [Phenylobacterium haematophilum]MBB3890562.1 ParB family chromosome partitioning protein [Phenylobacterium haematophilum]
MAKALPKITLSPSRDIPFDRLVLSQSNVRRVKNGVTINDLADDIERRGLLQGLNVRPQLDDAGAETGVFEIPAGGRRYRALEVLVKRKRLARTALVPCVVKPANDPVLAEEDSLAENNEREPLHPLDEFRGMQRLVERGEAEEAIAAHFRVTPAVVRQRLKLASVSPALHEVYADGGMTLDQLMAFTVSDDHARQEQVWEILAHSHNKSPGFIRARLTEATVPAVDARARFVGIDAYVQAGGCVLRDLFEEDRGGWLQDAALLDKLASDKLKADAEAIAAEGWKWVEVAIDLPYGFDFDLRALEPEHTPPTEAALSEVATLQAEADALENEWSGADEIPDEIDARVTEIDEAIATLNEGTWSYDPAQIAIAGAFVTIGGDGQLAVERGWVRPEDEPVAEVASEEDEADGDDPAFVGPRQPNGEVQSAVSATGGAEPASIEEEDDVIKPLSDRLVSELTAERTLALQDAFAQNPSVAFAAVLHSFVLAMFYWSRSESCLSLTISRVNFPFQATGLKNSPSAKAIEARHAQWKAKLPDSDTALWDVLQQFDAAEQAALFAHCAAYAVNAVYEVAPKYDNGRVSAQGVARRIEHSHVLARAVALDMVGAGWSPTVDNYFGKVTKARILEAVAEGKGNQTSALIDHLKKPDMAREAERLMADAAWLPEPLRTPVPEVAADPEMTATDEAAPASAGATGVGQAETSDPRDDGYAIAAE